MGFPVGGTGVGGSPVPPSINESQTSAFNETMKNVIGMLPFDTSAIIPFTQQNFDQVFHYRSEANHPMLHPLLFLRSSVETEKSEDESFQKVYQELLDQLPTEIKEWLMSEMNLPFSERDPDAVALHHTLSAAASTICWLSVACAPIEPDSPTAVGLMINRALPFIAMQGALDQAEFVLQESLNALNEAGPNDPHYDAYNSSLADIQEAIIEALALHREMEKGRISEDLREHLIDSALLMHKIATNFTLSEQTNNLYIIGAQLDALATATSSLAISHGTPSLVLGSSIASIGLNTNASALGASGKGFNKVMDGIVEGILGSFIYGPRAEINELTSLYHDLATLRDSKQEI